MGKREQYDILSGAGYLGKLGLHMRQFIRMEASAGIILMAVMVLAVMVNNSPVSDLYDSFLMLEGEVRVGTLSVEKPLVLWVNDLWMAIFFFMVGMEIKEEVLHGQLSDRRQIVLPLFGAVGGMLVPALIYLWFNWNDPLAVQGWAVPTATDIAFALGVLALLGKRIPGPLRIFLMTLAILDDLGAIIVIALFYTANLSLTSLLLGAVAVCILATLNIFRVMNAMAYIVVGIALWVCVLKSGVHATLAGVITAFAIPGKASGDTPSPLEGLIDALHPWVAFGILPMFAFVNTGINFAGLDAGLLFGGIPLGITLGLFIGKQIGVFGLSWLAISCGLAKKPPGVSMIQLYGVAALCGIGFTMSLFIGGLAFEEAGIGYARVDRLGVLIGSLLSGIVGYLVLYFASGRKPGNLEATDGEAA